MITPDSSFGFDDVELWVADMLIATLSQGDIFDFTSSDMDILTIMITGLDSLLDIDAPGFVTAFPVYLDWTSEAARLLMSALIGDNGGVIVPEPAVPLLFAMVLAGLIMCRKRIFLTLFDKDATPFGGVASSIICVLKFGQY